MDEQKIHARVIIEMMGAPKEHIVKTMELLMEKIKSDENFKLIGFEVPDPVEKDDFWSLFSEMEIEVKNIPELVGFCFDYMPSSVEILSPDNFSFKAPDFSGVLNDMQERLHQIDMVMKGVNAENRLLKKNGTVLLQNIVLFQLKQGEKSLSELSKGAGIPDDQLKKFLDVLIKNNLITEANGKYAIIKK